MKRELRRWEIVGFAVTGLVGTLLHFVYGWSDGSRVAAAFSAVNESTWEHMKLLFLPYFVFAVVEFIVFSEAFRNFFAVKAVSILLGLAATAFHFAVLRCPHCGRHLGRERGDTCPHCGRSLTEK